MNNSLELHHSWTYVDEMAQFGMSFGGAVLTASVLDRNTLDFCRRDCATRDSLLSASRTPLMCVILEDLPMKGIATRLVASSSSLTSGDMVSTENVRLTDFFSSRMKNSSRSSWISLLFSFSNINTHVGTNYLINNRVYIQ